MPCPTAWQLHPRLRPDPTNVRPRGTAALQPLQTQHRRDSCSSIHPLQLDTVRPVQMSPSGGRAANVACSTGLVFLANQAKCHGDRRVLGCHAFRPCQCMERHSAAESPRFPAPAPTALPAHRALTCYHSLLSQLRTVAAQQTSRCPELMDADPKITFFSEKNQPPSHPLSPKVLAINLWLKPRSQILLQGRRINPPHVLQELSWFQLVLLY